MPLHLPRVIVLMGPTASGKTELAIRLVERLPCEVVSVDSAMVYRGMDIGTAKPNTQTLRRVPHRLVDILDPSEAYSAAQFVTDAQREIAEIVAVGKIPLLVGGTLLYFRALLQGLSPLPSANLAVREALNIEAERDGWARLHAQLAEVDPAAAQRIHLHDTQRIQRALEVYRITGQPISELQKVRQAPSVMALKVALMTRDRKVLHQRIEARFQQMLSTGFEAEVKQLYQRGDLSLSLPAMKSVGYRQMWQYLDGQFSYDEMMMRGIAASRQLAKRQLTWLRSETDVVRCEAGDENNADTVIREYNNVFSTLDV